MEAPATDQALEKVFVILDKEKTVGKTPLAGLLDHLLAHVSVTSNLYLVTDDLSGAMPRIEAILAAVGKCLDRYAFLRMYVHVVHPVCAEGLDRAQDCYGHLKRHMEGFEREGYMHQEVPRLMLLPLVIWEGTSGCWDALGPFLEALKRSFLPPSLYVPGQGEPLLMDDRLTSSVEKVYYGAPYGSDLAPIVLSLGRQGVVDDASSRLESDRPVAVPCPAHVVVWEKEGQVFPCLDAFANGAPAVPMDGADPGLWPLVGVEPQGAGCLSCRERMAVAFSRFSIPTAMRQEVGALLFHLGTLYQEQQRYDRALACFVRSLTLSPQEEQAPTFFRIGFCHAMAGDNGQALEAFGKVEEAYGQEHFFHFYVGICHFQQGDFPSALERFLKADALVPSGEDAVQILLYAGTCLTHMGRYASALGPLNKAKDRDPGIKEVWSSLGYCHFCLQDYDKAIESLKRAVAIDPFSAVDYASLGANYRDKGDPANAIAMFEKALALDPGIKAAAENLKRLRRAP